MATPAWLLRVEADRLPPISTANNPPSTATNRLPPLLDLIPRPAGAWRVVARVLDTWTRARGLVFPSLSPFLSLTLSFNFEVLALFEYLFCLMC